MTTLAELISRAEAYVHTLPPAPPPLAIPTGAALAAWIDHTLLKPEATAEQIKQLCTEARQHKFATVCVNPAYISLAYGLLREAGVAVCSVVAFPLGAHLPAYKAMETRGAIEAGATEIDMVINIGALKSGAYALVLNDIQVVVDEAHRHKVPVKVILENALLDQREKIMGCLLCQEAKADFVKTSTGFSTSGATVADVALMRCVVGAGMGVKAAGGIRTYKDAVAMIRAGANRLGASASLAILQEAVQGAPV